MTVSGKLGIAIRKITAILAINDKSFKITTFKFSEIDKKNLWDSIFSNFIALKPSSLQKKKKNFRENGTFQRHLRVAFLSR